MSIALKRALLFSFERFCVLLVCFCPWNAVGNLVASWRWCAYAHMYGYVCIQTQVPVDSSRLLKRLNLYITHWLPFFQCTHFFVVLAILLSFLFIYFCSVIKKWKCYLPKLTFRLPKVISSGPVTVAGQRVVPERTLRFSLAFESDEPNNFHYPHHWAKRAFHSPCLTPLILFLELAINKFNFIIWVYF